MNLRVFRMCSEITLKILPRFSMSNESAVCISPAWTMLCPEELPEELLWLPCRFMSRVKLISLNKGDRDLVFVHTHDRRIFISKTNDDNGKGRKCGSG